MTVQEEKQALRKEMRQRIRQISPEERMRSSESICSRLCEMEEYLSAKCVFCFVGTEREIDTRPFLADVLARGKRLCVPRCVGKGGMELICIESLDQLHPGAYGILEPDQGAAMVSTETVDFAVIPCLACTYAGHRLGRGGGYYDRFLSHYEKETILICQEAMICPRIPMEPHDRMIQRVLTEKNIYGTY